MSRHAYWIASLLFSVLVLAKFNPQTGLTLRQNNISQQLLVGIRYVLQ